MGIVAIDMSMSLDGYIAAPNDIPGDGLGDDGMRLHNWAFDNPGVFERVLDGAIQDTGAVIMGRRTYDNSIPEWGDSGPIGDVPRAYTGMPSSRRRARSPATTASG